MATANISQLMSPFLYDVMNSITELDPYNKNVQFQEDGNGYASGDTTFLFAGPPVLNVGATGSKLTGGTWNITDYLCPIGATQQGGLQVGRQVIPFPELGSFLKRHAVGKGSYQFSMSRVKGISSDINMACYLWLKPLLAKMGYDGISLNHLPGGKSMFSSTDKEALNYRETKTGDGDATISTPLPNFLSGRDSELFKLPYGMLMITATPGNLIIEATYLENMITNFDSTGMAAGSPLSSSSLSAIVTRPVPFVDEAGNYKFQSSSLAKASYMKTFSL